MQKRTIKKGCKMWLFLSMLLGAFTNLAPAQGWINLDAVAYKPGGERYYFFYDEYYVVKYVGEPIDGFPTKIADGFKGFPKTWVGGDVDAVAFNADNDCYYFFRGDEYARKPVGKPFDKGPTKFNDPDSGFKGMPWGKVDAACYNADSDTYWFVSGGEYTSKKKGEKVSSKKRKLGDGGFTGYSKNGLDEDVRGIAWKPSWVSGSFVRVPLGSNYYFFGNKTYSRKEYKQSFAKDYPINYSSGDSGFKWRDRPEKGFVGFVHDAGYVAKFYLEYKLDGKTKKWNSGWKTFGYDYVKVLPKGATDIEVRARAATGYDFIEGKRITEQIFYDDSRIAPDRFYKVYGTVFDPSYNKKKEHSGSVHAASEFIAKDVPDALAAVGHGIKDVAEEFGEWMKDQALKALIAMVKEEYLELIKKTDKAWKEIAKNNTEDVKKLERAIINQDEQAAFEAVSSLVSNNSGLQNVLDNARLNKFGSLMFISSGSASAGVGAAGAGGNAFDIASLLYLIEHGKLPNTNRAFMSSFVAGGVSAGTSAGAGVSVSMGWNVNTPDEIGGPAIDANIEGTLGMGVDVNAYWDPSAGMTFGGFSVGLSGGGKVEGSGGASYTKVVTVLKNNDLHAISK